MSTTTYTGTLIPRECSCGVIYAITDRFEAARREDHKTFYCPNGCSRHYPQKTETEKLRDRLARERHIREQTHARLRDLESTMSPELREATEEAKAFRHAPAQKGAFWRGYESRGCAVPSDCPYDTNRGGFRRAWFAGADIDDPELGGER